MTSRRVEIDDEAKIEARNAYRWYLERNPVVAEAFEQEFQDAIELLKSEAHTFPTYEAETRRYLLPTYPYALLFELIEGIVFVTAVMHLKRKPGYWK